MSKSPHPHYTSLSGSQRHPYIDHAITISRNRRFRIIVSVLLFLYVFSIFNARKHIFLSQPHHIITSSSIEAESDLVLHDGSTHGFLPYRQARKLCHAHNWAPYGRRHEPRKIYDLIIMNNELDWLEIRLETMGPHVDYFVIIESTVTFTGLEKPRVLQLNWARFAPFHEKIIYKVLEGPPPNATRTWDLEDYQRNAMLVHGVMEAGEGREAKKNDVLIVADVDEIVRPATLQLLRECDIPPRLTLRSRFYYYGFQFEHRGLEWGHPQATVYRGNNTILPADLRNGEGGFRLFWWWDKQDLWNSGWHCSSCFKSVGDMLTKMQSFSHTSLNQEFYRNRTRIVEYVSKGLDLWDREGEIYDRIENNEDIPEYVKRKTRFGYLENRDGPSAGFIDFPDEGAKY